MSYTGMNDGKSMCIKPALRRDAGSRGVAHVGDKYHRLGASIEITEVTATRVVWEMADAQGCSTHSATHEDFARMEAKSLEWGARFEPAPNTAGEPLPPTATTDDKKNV